MEEKPAEEKKELTPDNFVKEYNEICQKYQMEFVNRPVWILRDDGTWSLRIESTIKKYPIDK